MNLVEHSLTCDIFPSRHPAAQSIEQFNSVYRFWHSIWSKTFFELKGQEKVHSDDFDRHDEIIAVTVRNEVIGAVLLNWYDLNIDSHRQHSYFSTYPDAAVERIKEGGARFVMTIGNLSVHPKWRRTQVDGLRFGMSDLLMGLASKRFLHSPADHWIAFTRNDRKVNELCFSHGAKRIAANLKAHNVSVDIVSTPRDEAVISENPVAEDLVHRLWDKKKMHGFSEIPDAPPLAQKNCA